MVGGSLTAKNGGMFYTTQHRIHLLLQNVAIPTRMTASSFLNCTGTPTSAAGALPDKTALTAALPPASRR